MLSIILGLIALALPTSIIVKLSRQHVVSTILLQVALLISMALCALAIWCEYQFQLTLLQIADYSAMLDIMPTSVNAALLLLIMDIILNMTMLIMSRRHLTNQRLT